MKWLTEGFCSFQCSSSSRACCLCTAASSLELARAAADCCLSRALARSICREAALCLAERASLLAASRLRIVSSNFLACREAFL